jgi:hypothetical protein
VRLKLTVRGPNSRGAYDLLLDNEPIADGRPAKEAARYVGDAWSLGGVVVAESATGKTESALPPDLTRELQALGLLPRPVASPEATRPDPEVRRRPAPVESSPRPHS